MDAGTRKGFKRLDSTAFTLLEVVLVISFIAIIIMVSYRPDVQTAIHRSALSSALTQLHKDLSYSRETAMNKEKLIRIDLDSSGQRYTLKEADSTDSDWTVIRSNIPVANNVSFKAITLTDEVLIFDENGIPYQGDQSPGSSLTGELTAEETVTLKVDIQATEYNGVLRVFPETGFVRREY